MRRLVALDLPGGGSFVEQLQRAWDAGDAVLPLDQRLPAIARAQMMSQMRAGVVVDHRGATDLPDGLPVEDGDALVVATSGSSGTPKGVVLTHAAVEASARATSARLEVTADDRWLACLPLSHIGGLAVVTRALYTSTELTVLPGFDPVAAVHTGATLVSLVATALRRIDPTVFRTIVLGGSRPPADRPANAVTTYGMTETGSGVVYEGRPLDGVEVRIVDGEIQLRCPMLLRCYRDGHDPRTADGWFPTADLGELRDGGGVSVLGRRGELIITGGENVWPEPIEVALRALDGVADAAVIGVPDPEWGEAVVALIVPDTTSTPPTLDAVRAHVKSTLPAFCAPKRIVFRAELPRTTLGKLRRAELTDDVAD